jgi:hypothetical protein
MSVPEYISIYTDKYQAKRPSIGEPPNGDLTLMSISIYTYTIQRKENFMAQLNPLIRSFNLQVGKVQPDGYILQGSVVKRNLRRRAGGVLKIYGPYFLWTRKIKNKTVTLALTAEQAQIIRDAIRRNRKMEQRLARLRSLSEQIIRAITPCVAKRNRA